MNRRTLSALACFVLLACTLANSQTPTKPSQSRELTPQTVVLSVPLGQNEQPLEMTISN
jgi:hypothetical protein